MIHSGKNRERINITVTVSVRDPGGGMKPGAKTSYWETWAAVTTIKNTRNAEAYQTDLEEPKEFKIRYRPDKKVTKNMLVEYNGEDYTIQSLVDTNERKREQIIIGLKRT